MGTHEDDALEEASRIAKRINRQPERVITGLRGLRKERQDSSPVLPVIIAQTRGFAHGSQDGYSAHFFREVTPNEPDCALRYPHGAMRGGNQTYIKVHGDRVQLSEGGELPRINEGRSQALIGDMADSLRSEALDGWIVMLDADPKGEPVETARMIISADEMNSLRGDQPTITIASQEVRRAIQSAVLSGLFPSVAEAERELLGQINGFYG